MKRVLGLGNALTDILLQVSEGDLREIGFPKGSMNLINEEQLEKIQTRFISVRKHLVAGGSASNTVATIAQLGGKTAFIGKIGTDEVGKFYREDLIKNNVKPILLSSSLMSGCCIVLITPDGERTFCTYLGAAADLRAEDIRKEAFMLTTSGDISECTAELPACTSYQNVHIFLFHILQERILRVFCGKDDLVRRNAPVYTEVRIIPRDCTFAFGMVIIVTFVLEDHFFREYAESVSESSRDEKHPVILV